MNNIKGTAWTSPDLEDLTWAARHPKAFKQLLTYAIIFLALLAGIILLRPKEAEGVDAPTIVVPTRKISLPTAAPKALQKAVSAIVGTPKGGLARVTWFSSTECHTTWCRANAGEPRGHKVALNPRFGKATKVYIPAFDQTYDVIGSTDQNTDVDVWCELDDACQTQVAARTLLINVIK